jgi:pyruvate carboxylase
MLCTVDRGINEQPIQEIAIRVFRTAHELAMHTVAIFSYEDRMSAHRQKVRRCLPFP